jgi:hypothetical protein
MNELVKEWPTPSEVGIEKPCWKVQMNKKDKRQMKVADKSKGETSFADKCKDMEAGTVLLIGDSMVRGIGQHLKADNMLFDKLDFGGAKIEDILEKLSIIGD